MAKYVVDVNCRDKKRRTALFIASFSDKLGVVQLLLQHEGLKVNLQNGRGQTALWVACACGNSKIVRTLLLDKRVDMNVKTMKGSTALNVAILKGYDEVVRLLKEHTARVPAVDERWVLMNDNVDVNRPTDESHSMDCDGMPITSSQIQEF